MSGFKSDEMIGSSCKDNILIHMSDEGRILCMEDCPLAAAKKMAWNGSPVSA